MCHCLIAYFHWVPVQINAGLLKVLGHEIEFKYFDKVGLS
jgi:hypothetical protein